MKALRMLLLIVGVVILVVVVGGALMLDKWTRGPLPQYDGEVAISNSTMTVSGQSVDTGGLRGSVEIIRDNWGVPHIYASTLHDLFFAQGYAQAQDRWWQMEFARHVGSGRIQELTGQNDAVMGQDVFIRTVGWRRAAERDLEAYDDGSQANLQAFADGVNAYILNRSAGDLALEYNLLGLTGVKIPIEPWGPVDSLVWAKVMAWQLSGNRSAELLRSQLYEKLGQEMTDEYLPPWPFGEKPTIVRAEDLPITEASLTARPTNTGIVGVSTMLAGGITPDNPIFREDRSLGSNNWVVSGKLTESGKPLLANDPHLPIQMPSIWYEVALHCQPVSAECPLEVAGFALPADPGVIIGHNANIAWGFTNVGPDTQDLYKIKVNPENELQYEWNGEWRDMTVHEETIRFGDGGDPVTIKVRETHLGPIINDNQIDADTGDIQGFNNKDPMALHWTATAEAGTVLKAIQGFDEAKNWEEFREAASYFDAPAQNLVYADTEGNIGYQTPGRIPVRAEGHSGLLPVPGWTDEYEWRGYIPFDDLPRVLNPERGYIATANQAVVPLEYYDQLKEKLAGEFGENANFFISQEWDYGYRGQRISQLLETTDKHTMASLEGIQGDNKNLSAEEVMPYLKAITFESEELTDARDWLLDWDFMMNMDSPQAALYASFWLRLMDNLFDDQLGEGHRVEGGDDNMRATFLLLDKPDDAWWDDTRTSDVTETRDDILARSFQEGYDATAKALGADRGKWRWGDLHTAIFVSNPLGQAPDSVVNNLVKKIVNRGPVATGGGSAIVNATSWSAASGNLSVRWLPSMRFIADLSDLSRSVTMHTTGQSGHPFSAHYGDMIDSWRKVEYHPMLWTREQVEEAAADKLVLKPGS